MTNTTNNSTSVVLSNDCARLVVESANGAASGFAALKTATENLALAMGEKPSLPQWEAVANGWKAQYRTKTGASDDAVNMAWSRMVKRLGEEYGLDKPKAASKAATKKAEDRSEKAKAVEKAIADHGNDAVKLADAAAKAVKAGDVKQAKVLTDAAMAIQSDAAKAAKKASDDALKAARDKVRELVKSADAAMLEKVLGVLSGELVVAKKRTK